MKIHNSKKNLVFCMLTKCLGFAFVHIINSHNNPESHVDIVFPFHRKEMKAWRREVTAQGDTELGPRDGLPGHLTSQPFKDTSQEIIILS